MPFDYWPIAEQHTSHHLQTRHQHLWCQILWKRSFQTSTPHPHLPPWKIRTRLGRWIILWYHPQLGLRGRLYFHVYNWLRKKCIIRIPACPAINNTRCPNPMEPPNLCNKTANDELCQNIGKNPPCRHQVITTCYRKFLYYGRAVNSTTLAALRYLSKYQ